MKILVLNGSPRGRGNTYNVVKEFEEYSNINKDLSFEYLFLNKADIKLCIGCHNCIFIGEDKCPIKDDRKKIEDKMLSSDAVIIATPSYVLNVPAVLKNFLDRTAYNFHRPKFFKQKLFIISTSSDYATQTTNNYLKNLTGMGFQLIGTLGIFPEMFPFTEKEKLKNKIKIKKAAESFYKNLISKKPPEISFGDILQLRIFRSISDLLKNIFKADYKYYLENGLYDKKIKYYSSGKVRALNVFFANLLEKIIKKSFSKMIDRERLNKLSNNRKKS